MNTNCTIRMGRGRGVEDVGGDPETFGILLEDDSGALELEETSDLLEVE